MVDDAALIDRSTGSSPPHDSPSSQLLIDVWVGGVCILRGGSSAPHTSNVVMFVLEAGLEHDSNRGDLKRV